MWWQQFQWFSWESTLHLFASLLDGTLLYHLEEQCSPKKYLGERRSPRSPSTTPLDLVLSVTEMSFYLIVIGLVDIMIHHSLSCVFAGDICYYDKEERFFIVDRIKELIKYKAFQVIRCFMFFSGIHSVGNVHHLEKLDPLLHVENPSIHSQVSLMSGAKNGMYRNLCVPPARTVFTFHLSACPWSAPESSSLPDLHLE